MFEKFLRFLGKTWWKEGLAVVAPWVDYLSYSRAGFGLISDYFQPTASRWASFGGAVALLGTFSFLSAASNAKLRRSFKIALSMTAVSFVVCMVLALMLGRAIVPASRAWEEAIRAIWVVCYVTLFVTISVAIAVAGVRGIRIKENGGATPPSVE